MTGLFTSPEGVPAWTFSVIFRIDGAAAMAPTAAAPTAVLCRKLRLDIFDFFSSAIRFPSVRVREETSRTISGRPHRLEGYFDVCNIVCYKWIGFDDQGRRASTAVGGSGRGIATPAFRCPRGAAGRVTQEPLGPTVPTA